MTQKEIAIDVVRRCLEGTEEFDMQHELLFADDTLMEDGWRKVNPNGWAKIVLTYKMKSLPKGGA